MVGMWLGWRYSLDGDVARDARVVGMLLRWGCS